MKLKKENLKFLFLPVAMALTVLIAVILAKDATIRKTLSVANTKTIACTSANYSDRTSDSVCGTGYTNTSNNCTATPTYNSSCNSGDSGPTNGVCTSSYTATATCMHSPTPSGYSGSCSCTNNGYDWVDNVSCGSSSTCNIACINADYAAALSGSCTATYDSSSCTIGGLLGGMCVYTTSGSCPSGWSRSYGDNSCPNGGTVNTSTGKCESTYDAIQTQTGTTYSGNIICSAITYTVAYDKNGTGATGTTANSTHEYDVAKTLTQNGYTWGGHVFNGWNSKADGTGTNYTDKQSVTNLTSTNGATVTLYAKWTTCPAGTYAAAGATSCTSCSGNTISAAGASSCTECGTGKIANSAHTACTNITYTVTYNKNGTGATGTTANSTHEYGVAKTLTQNGYTWGGHVFNGWNSKADGTGTNYTDKQSVTNLASTNGATVTLYAKWTTCAAGTYAAAGATTCSPCTGNTISAAGASSCTECGTGQAANSSHTVCEDTQNDPVTCPAGKYMRSGGTTLSDCENCPAGTYSTAGSTTCTPCTNNTYASTPGQSSCTPCEENQIANSDHTGCQPRPDDTVTCQAGTYLKANGTTSDDCEICPVGFYCPGGDFVPLDEDQGKNLCPVNHIDGETGTIVQEFCKLKCATGTYKVEPEASMCVACPTGKTSKEHLVNFGEVSPDGTCYADGDIVSPKTGLIEVGGLLIGTLGLGAVVYIVLRKRKIINI